MLRKILVKVAQGQYGGELEGCKGELSTRGMELLNVETSNGLNLVPEL